MKCMVLLEGVSYNMRRPHPVLLLLGDIRKLFHRLILHNVDFPLVFWLAVFQWHLSTETYCLFFSLIFYSRKQSLDLVGDGF